jgi:Na+/H+ antiporter NhaD/arsenite permease-like protein
MTGIAVVVFVVAYVLIATEWTHKLLAALGGAAVLLALGVTDSEHAFYSHETGIDWDVIFLLFGMMVNVGIVRRTGVFEFIAIWATKRAKGSPLRVLILLTLITAVASAFLDNVTTVLLIAPVTLLVCDRLGINPVPFLIAEVMASNIGGAATLIGDPPNIIIASRSGLTFNDFLVHIVPLVLIELAVFTLVLPWLFKGSFMADPERVEDVMRLNEREAIEDRRLLIKCGAVLLLVFAGFVGRAVVGAVGGGAARCRAAGVDLRSADAAVHDERGVADAVVLRRPVRDGRRTGQDWCDR